MATTQNATPITLTVTDKAAAEVRKFMAEEHVTPETAGLRVGVLPGGCSGFRYSLSIEDKPAADDIVIESGGVRCFVDSFSAQYLNGVTLDFKSNFLEIALVVQRHAVQVLGAEAVYEAAHAAALDHDVVGGGLVLNAQAVAEPRAAARQHADPQAGGLGRHVLLRHELPDFRGRLVGDGERDGGRVLRRRHDVSSDQTGS